VANAGTHQFLAGRGIFQYERQPDDRIAVTLLRAAGTIRRDLAMYAAPGGAELGRHSFEYAFGFADSPSGIMRESLRFRRPPAGFQFPFLAREPVESIVTFTNPNWVLSAIKRPEKGGGMVIRIWNCSDSKESGTLGFGIEIGRLWILRLDEAVRRPIDIGALINLRPKEIMTFLAEGPDSGH
jgi:alpha-mannosidase